MIGVGCEIMDRMVLEPSLRSILAEIRAFHSHVDVLLCKLDTRLSEMLLVEPDPALLLEQQSAAIQTTAILTPCENPVRKQVLIPSDGALEEGVPEVVSVLPNLPPLSTLEVSKGVPLPETFVLDFPFILWSSSPFLVTLRLLGKIHWDCPSRRESSSASEVLVDSLPTSRHRLILDDSLLLYYSFVCLWVSLGGVRVLIRKGQG